MFKIALIKFESNLAVSIDGGKRQTFKKGDYVIVGKNDILMLLRLGCTVVNEREINYKEHKDLFKVSKEDIAKANEEFEKVVDNKTLEQLEVFAEAIIFTNNCDEKYCTKYTSKVLQEKREAKAEKERADQEAKAKAEKEIEAKAKAEKE